MQLAEFLSNADNPHSQAGNPSVACNALYKTKQNFNCYLTPTQAISLARHLLEKAQILIDNEVEDAAVQVWSQGEHNEKLYLGLTQARKGPRKKKKVAAKADAPETSAAEPITRQHIDELLHYLPLLGNPGPETEPRWSEVKTDPATGAIPWPHPEYPKVVKDFFELVAQPCWCDYDYGSSGADEMIRDDAAIASASLAQVKSMLTFCAQGERFCDGHWGAVVQEGRVGAILRRLAQLRDSVSSAAPINNCQASQERAPRNREES